MDAFSSDAIPVHLLTSEAFEVYGRHLKTNGIIAVHISNRHLDLEPVITRLADHFQYRAAVVENAALREKYWIIPSQWLLLSASEETIRSLSTCAGGRQARASSAQTPLWTDDFASLYPIVRWGARSHMEPRLAESEVAVAGALWEKGELSGAVTHFRAALKLDPDFAEASNNLAWLLATSPDDSLRNGPEAVRLAERACKLTGYQKTIMVGTLAAAYAEVGRFPDAVATAEKACRLASVAGEDALLKKNQKLLQLYRAGKPHRER